MIGFRTHINIIIYYMKHAGVQWESSPHSMIYAIKLYIEWSNQIHSQHSIISCVSLTQEGTMMAGEKTFQKHQPNTSSTSFLWPFFMVSCLRSKNVMRLFGNPLNI